MYAHACYKSISQFDQIHDDALINTTGKLTELCTDIKKSNLMGQVEYRKTIVKKITAEDFYPQKKSPFVFKILYLTLKR